MSSEELRAIAHDDPKYLEASRNELAMRQIAADARIRDLERELDTLNAKNACKDVEIKALNDKLETSTNKATRLKSKYQNSQLAYQNSQLASGDIFDSLKKILTNYADQKKTLCTSKLHELFIALVQELDQSSKDLIKSYQANADLLEELCTKVQRKRQTVMCKICKVPKKGHKCLYLAFKEFEEDQGLCYNLEDFKIDGGDAARRKWNNMNSNCQQKIKDKISANLLMSASTQPRKKARVE